MNKIISIFKKAQKKKLRLARLDIQPGLGLGGAPWWRLYQIIN
jgi:hypothetical protein